MIIHSFPHSCPISLPSFFHLFLNSKNQVFYRPQAGGLQLNSTLVLTLPTPKEHLIYAALTDDFPISRTILSMLDESGVIKVEEIFSRISYPSDTRMRYPLSGILCVQPFFNGV